MPSIAQWALQSRVDLYACCRVADCNKYWEQNSATVLNDHAGIGTEPVPEATVPAEAAFLFNQSIVTYFYIIIACFNLIHYCIIITLFLRHYYLFEIPLLHHYYPLLRIITVIIVVLLLIITYYYLLIIIGYYYFCYYLIITHYYGLIITYYYRTNGFIITGFIITYHRPEQLGEVVGNGLLSKMKFKFVTQ